MEDKDLYNNLLTGHFVGSLTKEEEEMLGRLLSEDETFRLKYNEISKLFSLSSISTIESQKAANYEQLKKRLTGLADEKEEKKTVRKWFNNYRGIAAIITILILFGGIFLYQNKKDNEVEIFETIALNDSKIKTLLPDSSIVWLNSKSKLVYSSDFGKKERRVFLEGEGYFDIRKKEGNPFFVQTKELEVKVTGTIFNFDAYVDEQFINIVLMEGEVLVKIIDNSHNDLTLRPNQVLIFNKQTKELIVKDIVSDEYPEWMNEKLTFNDATFYEIIKMLELKYKKTIIIKNTTLNNEIFSGSIDNKQSLKEAISTFDVEGKLSFKQVKDTLYIY